MGLKVGKLINILFIMKRKQELHIIQVYVDDIIFRATLMGNEFVMIMMGDLTFFLGLQIKQTPNGTSTSKEKYTEELLKKFKIVDSKLIDSHMGTNSKWE